MNAESLRGVAVAMATAMLVVGPGRAANPEIPAGTFRPALDATGTPVTDSGAVAGHLVGDVGLTLDYALNPLVAAQRNADGVTRVAALVSHRLGSDLVASIGLFDWVQLGLDLPVALFQTRDSNVSALEVGSIATSNFALVGIGDLRLRGKVRVLRAEDAGVDLAIVPTLTLPTHTPAGSFLGETLPTFVPEVAVSRNLGSLFLAGNVGARLRGDAALEDLALSHELTYRGGIAFRFDPFPLRVGADLVGSAALLTPFADVNQNPLEVLASVDYQTAPGVQASLAAGFGLIAGYGTPDVRVVASLRYRIADDDLDDDGLADVDDVCPDEPEDKDGFRDADGCPDADNDDDGLADADDRCPDKAEDDDDFRDDDGCPDVDDDDDGLADADDRCPRVAGPFEFEGCPPPDADGDGIADRDDRCPADAGLPALLGCPDADGDGVADGEDRCPGQAGVAALGGCPDGDGDGIVDGEDACPTEVETKNGVSDEDGCPDTEKTKISIRREQIEILEQVLFDLGKARIKRQSFDLLDQVVKVLQDHPELRRVRVEGHTDDLGSEPRNQKLSNDRARSVVDYLVKKGVDPARLQPVGFGATQPQAPNDTDANRQKNRRVVFVILER